MERAKDSGEQLDNELIETFVGSNFEYYDNKWQSMDERNSKFSFNLPAILILPVWLAYRKMFTVLIIYMGIIYGLGIVELIAEMEIPNSTYLALSLIMGLMANSIYRDFVKKKVKHIKDNHSKNDVENVIEKKGGTSPAAAAAVVIVNVLLLIWVIADFMNQYSAH